MGLTNFISKHARARSSPRDVAAELVDELDGRLNDDFERRKPEHIDSQLDRVEALFDTDDEVWMIFLDAGRYDLFDELVGEFFDGRLNRVYNGGVGYTGDWTVRHLSGDFGRRGLFSWVPLRGFGAATYDGRDHFYMAPDIQQDIDVDERLAALGYKERTTDEDISISPSSINEAVRRYEGRLNGGVVRYLKPHPPFNGLPEITSESTKTAKTWRALRSGEITYAELSEAYIDTYREGLRYARDLVDDLDGRVVITSDHGTCLGDCGQLFHGRRLEMHDHLTIMPWFEVER